MQELPVSPASQPTPVEAAANNPASALFGGDHLRTVVGPNAHIFMGRWVRMLRSAGRKDWETVWRPSLNWPALLLGSTWFFYRKMYAVGAGCVGAMLILGVAREYLGLPFGLEFLSHLAFGLFANAFYLKHVLRLASRYDNDSDRASAGGVSWPSAILCSLAASVLIAAASTALFHFRSGALSSLQESLKRCTDVRTLNAVAAQMKKTGAAQNLTRLVVTHVNLQLSMTGKATCNVTFTKNTETAGNVMEINNVTVRYVLPDPGQESSVKLAD